jgi:hypothetical protein
MFVFRQITHTKLAEPNHIKYYLTNYAYRNFRKNLNVKFAVGLPRLPGALCSKQIRFYRPSFRHDGKHKAPAIYNKSEPRITSIFKHPNDAKMLNRTDRYNFIFNFIYSECLQFCTTSQLNNLIDTHINLEMINWNNQTGKTMHMTFPLGDALVSTMEELKKITGIHKNMYVATNCAISSMRCDSIVKTIWGISFEFDQSFIEKADIEKIEDTTFYIWNDVIFWDDFSHRNIKVGQIIGQNYNGVFTVAVSFCENLPSFLSCRKIRFSAE